MNAKSAQAAHAHLWRTALSVDAARRLYGLILSHFHLLRLPYLVAIYSERSTRRVRPSFLI